VKAVFYLLATLFHANSDSEEKKTEKDRDTQDSSIHLQTFKQNTRLNSAGLEDGDPVERLAWAMSVPY